MTKTTIFFLVALVLVGCGGETTETSSTGSTPPAATGGECACVDGVDGAAGPQGPEGPQGFTGPAGAQGAQGQPGMQGPQGLAGDDGEEGPQGPQGNQGPMGMPGVPGPQGPAGTFDPTSVYTAMNSAFVATGTQSVSASCNAGDIAIGGGCTTNGTNINIRHDAPHGVVQPGDAPTGWFCQYSVGATTTINAWTICVDTQ